VLKSDFNLVTLTVSLVIRKTYNTISVNKQSESVHAVHCAVNLCKAVLSIVLGISDGIPELLESDGSSSVLTLKTIDAFFKFSPFAASYRCLNAGACLANCTADAAFLIFQTPKEVP